PSNQAATSSSSAGSAGTSGLSWPFASHRTWHQNAQNCAPTCSVSARRVQSGHDGTTTSSGPARNASPIRATSRSTDARCSPYSTAGIVGLEALRAGCEAAREVGALDAHPLGDDAAPHEPAERGAPHAEREHRLERGEHGDHRDEREGDRVE